MIRAIGIDPGTKNFDVCGLARDRLFLDETIPSADLAANPMVLVDMLRAANPIDLIVGPSGYGLPWIKAKKVGKRQKKLLTLSQERDHGQNAIVGGMHRLIQMLKESELPVMFAPALIHLPTVPAHRKVNRIDMGTADKLCAAALGIWDQARRLGIDYYETSFIFVELGGAFTAVMAVEKGKLVDGLGGTSGCLGYLSMGAMDGEIAYLAGRFHKELLCTGGVAHIAGQPQMTPEELITLCQTDHRCCLAWDALIENLVKCVAAEMVIVPNPHEILISGRLCRTKEIVRKVTHRLSVFAPVRRVRGFAGVAKEAAQGAALIAEGFMGGINEALVNVMSLHDACGTALDHLYFEGSGALTQKYLET